MSVIDSVASILTSGISGTIGGLAKDIRTAITGKAPETAEERQAVLDRISEIEKLALQADQAIIQGQLTVNAIEAGSGSIFKSGWRPAVGWVCVIGLFYQFIIKSILPWFVDVMINIFHLTFIIPVMPSLDMGTLMVLLSGMLGLGGMRTFEKLKNVD